MSRLEPTRTANRVGSESAADPSASHLMLRIRGGDTDALERLMGRYWPQLVEYAFQLLGSIDEANDVAQEVFVRTWELRCRWKAGGSAKAFLFGIARNLSLLQLRRRQVRTRSQAEIQRGSKKARTPIDDIFYRELHQALQDALGTLPDRRREAFALVRVDGLSLGAAADVMGVTKRTVANHVYMATTDLERALRPFLH